jgi:hypothetical protein
MCCELARSDGKSEIERREGKTLDETNAGRLNAETDTALIRRIKGRGCG